MEETVAHLGKITWARFCPIGLKPFRQTAQAAQIAVDSAKRTPRTRWSEFWKKSFYALQYNGARAFFEKQSADAVALVWNGLNGSRYVFAQAAKDAGCRTLYFELAPLPDRITVDPSGVNFNNMLPRSAKPYLDWWTHQGKPETWRGVAKQITQRQGASPPEDAVSGIPPLTENFIFAPLQVEGDSQLRLFGGDFKTVGSFVDGLIEASKALPKGWHLRIKEHPDNHGRFAEKIAKDGNSQVWLDNRTDTFEQVRASQLVITVNSSVGLQAMFFEKPVVACGECFWAIDGIASHTPERRAFLTLFRSPTRVQFVPEARSAFLEFLTTVYYPAKNSTKLNFFQTGLENVDL